jgi:predicted nucleotidyltransferase
MSVKSLSENKPSKTLFDWASLKPHVTESLLADITQRIVEAFQPAWIVLFGSYAYGTPNLDSDLDLIVVMESDEPMARRMMRVAEVAQERFLPMDVLVYTPTEIEERLAKKDRFIEEVFAKGRVLYRHVDS